MGERYEDLDIVEFADVKALHQWLEAHSTQHPGVWVQLRRARSQHPSVTFHDLLIEGIAFGWSESTRRSYDDDSYLQRFSPRRKRGTVSERNRRIAAELEATGRMTEAGRAALGDTDSSR